MTWSGMPATCGVSHTFTVPVVLSAWAEIPPPTTSSTAFQVWDPAVSEATVYVLLPAPWKSVSAIVSNKTPSL